jgi:hypothetical protein
VDTVPMPDSAALIDRPAELRARAAGDGYLLLRGLLPPAAVLAVRRDVLALAAAAGWCDEAGLARPGVRFVVGQPEFDALYDRVQRLEGFHRLALHPRLLGLYRALFGEPVLAHPRNIARIMFPENNAYATPAHQDVIYIHGTPETWTAWIPLGDCPRELGGIAVLVGSHRSGVYPTRPALGAGGRGIDVAGLPFPAAAADMDAGDVLTFHSHAIHMALPNSTRTRMRLSVDYRYQPAAQPVDASSLQPHHGRVSWEEIYAGWKSPEGRYYWRGLARVAE